MENERFISKFKGREISNGLSDFNYITAAVAANLYLRCGKPAERNYVY